VGGVLNKLWNTIGWCTPIHCCFRLSESPFLLMKCCSQPLLALNPVTMVLAFSRIILRKTCRFFLRISVIYENKTSSISSFFAFLPPPVKRFLLDFFAFVNSVNSFFCLHHSLILLWFTLNSLAAASLHFFLATSTAFSLKTAS